MDIEDFKNEVAGAIVSMAIKYDIEIEDLEVLDDLTAECPKVQVNIYL